MSRYHLRPVFILYKFMLDITSPEAYYRCKADFKPVNSEIKALKKMYKHVKSDNNEK